jgi:hypothetical protein
MRVTMLRRYFSDMIVIEVWGGCSLADDLFGDEIELGIRG